MRRLPVDALEKVKRACYHACPFAFPTSIRGHNVKVSGYVAGATVAALSIAISGLSAFAATQFMPLPQGAPVVVRDCSVVETYGNSFWDLKLDAGNLDEAKSLERLTLRFKFYDDVHVLLDDRSVQLKSLDVPPGETKRFTGEYYLPKASGARAIECSVLSATFYGGAMWHPGMTWKGRLTKVHTTDGSANGANSESKRGTPSTTNSAAAPASSSVTVEKLGGAWVDVTNNGSFIHARVQLNASASATIRASDLLLAIKLESGVTMQLPGIDRQAPMADKPFAVGATPSPQERWRRFSEQPTGLC